MGGHSSFEIVMSMKICFFLLLTIFSFGLTLTSQQNTNLDDFNRHIRWLPQYVEEEDETNENVRPEEGPVMIHIGYTNKDYNPDQVNHYLRSQRNAPSNMDKSRRDSERDHYFRSLKRSGDHKDQNDPSHDWTRYSGRIQLGANSNDQVWDTSDAPEIRDHYLRSMRSANDPQPNNVIRDHYLRSMRSAN